MFGVTDDAQHDGPEVEAQMAEASPINHLIPDDPPAYLTYGLPNTPPGENPTANQGAHSAVYGAYLKQKMDEMGIECVLRCPNCEREDPCGRMVTFLKSKLLPAQE